jgi:hypothetical protein
MRVAGTTTVTTEAQLNTAIETIDNTTTAGNYQIVFRANITEGNISVTQDGLTVLPDLTAVNLRNRMTTTIDGAGDNLIGTSGTNTFRGPFVYGGNVAVDNLTIKNAVAIGGAGGSSGNFAASGIALSGAGGGSSSWTINMAVGCPGRPPIQNGPHANATWMTVLPRSAASTQHQPTAASLSTKAITKLPTRRGTHDHQNPSRFDDLHVHLQRVGRHAGQHGYPGRAGRKRPEFRVLH